MKTIILESPFAGEVERNLAYVRECMRWALTRGMSPFASHALYTQPGVLDDNDPDERKLGIAAGLEWRRVADLSVFCVRYGWSGGMVGALLSAKAENRPYIVIDVDDSPNRLLPGDVVRFPDNDEGMVRLAANENGMVRVACADGRLYDCRARILTPVRQAA